MYNMTTDTTNLHSDRIDNSRELYNISNIHIDTYHIIVLLLLVTLYHDRPLLCIVKLIHYFII